jgi:hypothetical protein
MELWRSTPDGRRKGFSRAVCAFAIALSAVFLAAPLTASAQGKQIVPPDEPIEEPIEVPPKEQGWARVPFSGEDEYGRNVYTEIYQIEGVNGVALAPVPGLVRDQLIEEMAYASPDENVVFALNAQIVDEIQRSLELGEPTQALIEYANQDAEATAAGQMGARGPFGSCSDSEVTRSKRLQYSPNLTTTQNLGSGFSGTLSLQGGGNVDANGEVKLKVKRTKVFWVCVPYGVRLQHVRAVGSVSLNNTINLTGTVNYANPNPIDYEIANPSLGGIFFMLGPVPVYIGFSLPITVGLEIKASVSGQVQYRGGASITGSFDYLCTPSNCTGYNTLQTTTQNIANPLGASISGRIEPSLYAEVAARAFLYTYHIAYVQVGVRGYLHGDLWGYYGNTCGDADQNGHFETVSALTFGLDWQIAIVAKADTLFTSPWKSTLWKSKRWYIGYWDLIGSGSTALTPMIDGPATVNVNTGASYKIRMRPCWPYTDNVDYTMDWGDGGGLTNHSGPPAPPSWQPVLASRVWTTLGPKTMTLTALRDAHGRTFGNGRSTSRQIQVVNAPLVNRAPSALAVASSSYCVGAGTVHCYSPGRVNDGNNSTALGGFTSWTHNQGVAGPHWIELQWGSMQTISRVDLYTTSGYEISSYQIQYWNGTGWLAATPVITGNTAVARSHPIAPVQTFRLRVAVFAGPAIQPGHMRINELEVY